MKKKTYEFSSMGYAQFLLDCKQRKQKKVNMITSALVIGGLLACGFLGKEMVIIYGVNTLIDIATDYLI